MNLQLVSQTASSDTSYTLTIDDDPLVAKLIEKGLAIPSLALTGMDEVRVKMDHLNPKAVFLDIHLAEGSGLQLIPELKHHWPFIPVIVITADKNDAFLLEALARGADDYLVKPIKLSELRARLHRRWWDQSEKQAISLHIFADITIDAANATLKGPQSLRTLSPTELKLLSRLVQAQGSTVSRSSLKFSCWHQVSVSENALDRKIYEVRKALKDIGSQLEIETIYAEGFVLKMKNSPL